jgi:hypothetical protein
MNISLSPRKIILVAALALGATVATTGAASASGSGDGYGFGAYTRPPPGPQTYWMNEGGPVPLGCCPPGDQLNIIMRGYPGNVDRCFARGGVVRFQFGNHDVVECYGASFPKAFPS